MPYLDKLAETVRKGFGTHVPVLSHVPIWPDMVQDVPVLGVFTHPESWHDPVLHASVREAQFVVV